jgi:hypothetical protein
MNKARFARLLVVIGELTAIRDEEREAFENLPPNFQAADRGQDMENAVEHLDSAVDALAPFTD